MTAIGEWLDANRYEPIRYKYDDNEHTVLVTVDFATELDAEAFATRFDMCITHLRNLYPPTTRADPPRNRQEAPRPARGAFGPTATRSRIRNTG